MEMSIDEAILDLTALKICGVVPFTKGTISGGNYKVITEECLNTAINTMCKYQKIEKIVNNIFQNIAKEDERYVYEWLGDIKEVLEDGNVD